MNVGNQAYRTIWADPENPKQIFIIDQRKLPFSFEIHTLRSVADTAVAIREMYVRGAGLIGATAGWGMYLAALEAEEHEDWEWAVRQSAEVLIQPRPTAVNLRWAVSLQLGVLEGVRQDSKAGLEDYVAEARQMALEIADGDASMCRKLGQHGLKIFEELAGSKEPGEPVQVLTHCNAGWLAFVDYGSARRA